jgi:hypothetical protein
VNWALQQKRPGFSISFFPMVSRTDKPQEKKEKEPENKRERETLRAMKKRITAYSKL